MTHVSVKKHFIFKNKNSQQNTNLNNIIILFRIQFSLQNIYIFIRYLKK